MGNELLLLVLGGGCCFLVLMLVAMWFFFFKKTPAATATSSSAATSSTSTTTTNTSSSEATSGATTTTDGKQVPESVQKMLGLNGDQISTILSLVGGPEQSNVKWWLGANDKPVWGYCENIGDNRGITVGIAGFVSKFGEVQKLVKAYGASMDTVGDPGECKKGGKCKICDWITSKTNDPKWAQVQWDEYANSYFKPAVQYFPSKFPRNALIMGLLIDTSMNSGVGDEGNAWGVDHIAKAATGSTTLDWVNSFCDLRSAHFASGNPAETKKWRMETWKKLAKDGKWDLKGVDPCKYAFCYGKGLGDGCKGC